MIHIDIIIDNIRKALLGKALEIAEKAEDEITEYCCQDDKSLTSVGENIVDKVISILEEKFNRKKEVDMQEINISKSVFWTIFVKYKNEEAYDIIYSEVNNTWEAIYNENLVKEFDSLLAAKKWLDTWTEFNKRKE
jgi:HD-GYP domain-containing protein (c-di-GMP phosphodiesterase class II)